MSFKSCMSQPNHCSRCGTMSCNSRASGEFTPPLFETHESRHGRPSPHLEGLMKLLHIDSGILGTASVSRQLSADAVAEWRAQHPGIEVIYRDLVAQPLTHLAGDQLFAAGADPSQQSPQMRAILAESEAVLQEFLEADIVV